MAKAISYIVRHWNAYHDDVNAYIKCRTRADVEAELPDYGWLENPGVYVYKVTTGEDPDNVIRELAESGDPYPDYVVERGPRGGIQWNHA